MKYNVYSFVIGFTALSLLPSCGLQKQEEVQVNVQQQEAPSAVETQQEAAPVAAPASEQKEESAQPQQAEEASEASEENKLEK
ncbi:MAG: hypothetical protein US69_C0017G0026 [candidate division TM6 bacterium GW2011_GWF2_38_10]|nr:MAG: hypothetical protein US69_C0017G0026 [candidate division TM6 bacterium GW2011_GWF2_38_10]